MELTRLKGKLRTAQRGHKLLKDKRDELMKQFLDTVREVRSLRAEVEEELMTVHKSFTVASAIMSSEALEQALLYPKQSVELTQTFQNIMSVNVPVYHFQTKTKSDADIYPYGFASTSGELDTAVDALGKVFMKMLKLAEIEKSAQLMAEEIEKTRRRVNALEYVMIPNTQEAIRYITCLLYTSNHGPARRRHPGGDRPHPGKRESRGGEGRPGLPYPDGIRNGGAAGAQPARRGRAGGCLLYTSRYASSHQQHPIPPAESFSCQLSLIHIFIHDAQAFAAAPHPAAEPGAAQEVQGREAAFDPRLLERVYPYARETTLPSKVTATQLKGCLLYTSRCV